ncbi:MAG TPA: Gfo/Idh/MocA family oxidoreductase [Abditibacterium sp.]|jgi:hypothetical protein
MKIAILGASGIGRSHARWFARHGGEVVSILGSSNESAARTGATLQRDFGFAGLTFSDLGALLEGTRPDAVCVASPPELHFAHASACLAAGVHVLCEKPLVYAPTSPNRENLAGAHELVRLAQEKNLVLATQLQYGAATPILCKLAGTAPPEVGDFAMEMETFNPRASRQPRELWIDLAPHALSVAQVLGGAGAKLAPEPARIDVQRDSQHTQIAARFSIIASGGRLLTCRVILRAREAASGKAPLRRFAFNGRVVSYEGLAQPDGIYRAQYSTPYGYQNIHDDPVNYLIGDFLRAIEERRAPLMSGEMGAQNLSWLLEIADEFSR